MKQSITGFHAIEERLRYYKEKYCEKKSNIKQKKYSELSYRLYFDKKGPRIKKILDEAASLGIEAKQVGKADLDRFVASLSSFAREHRGLVLIIEGEQEKKQEIDDIAAHLSALSVSKETEASIVVVLDSISDPHNVGAILRSCDQFAVDLVIVPKRDAALEGDVIARTSAGASAWVPLAIVSNLVRSVEILKEAGYWIYGADAGGKSVKKIQFEKKTCLLMGSEGRGIARLLKESCDEIVSIPTFGKLDSLNVSVAAGILLHEIRSSFENSTNN